MFTQFWKPALGALAVLAMLIGAAQSQVAQPAEVMSIQPQDDRDVPEGSQIPDDRIAEIEAEVEAYKAKMRAKAIQQQKASPSEASEPETKQPE